MDVDCLRLRPGPETSEPLSLSQRSQGQPEHQQISASATASKDRARSQRRGQTVQRRPRLQPQPPRAPYGKKIVKTDSEPSGK